MPEIIFLAFAPWRLWLDVRIGASVHNLRDTAAETLLHFSQHRRATAIFHHIVQQSRNRHIFITAEFQRQRSYSHQVRDIGRSRGLAYLSRMFLRGKKKCLQKPRTQLDCVALLPAHYFSCFSPRRASRYARMNGCRSPSSTRSTSPTSVFVR